MAKEPKHFEKVDPITEALIAKVAADQHPELVNAEVKIDAIFAFAATDENGDPKGHAIGSRGCRVYAYVRGRGLKERTHGLGDCELVIDGDNWDDLNEKCRIALIDHELCHLVVRLDKDGNIRRDSLDRPCLAMRQHDREYGWFDEVAERNGNDSIEIQQFNDLKAQYALFDVGFREPSAEAE